jgi:hypothetical protein
VQHCHVFQKVLAELTDPHFLRCIRVSRLGEIFAYCAIVFYGQFFITEGAHIFGYLFSKVKVAITFGKITSWATLPKTYPVTLIYIHHATPVLEYYFIS